jgi:hypothetical protein
MWVPQRSGWSQRAGGRSAAGPASGRSSGAGDSFAAGVTAGLAAGWSQHQGPQPGLPFRRRFRGEARKPAAVGRKLNKRGGSIGLGALEGRSRPQRPQEPFLPRGRPRLRPGMGWPPAVFGDAWGWNLEPGSWGLIEGSPLRAAVGPGSLPGLRLGGAALQLQHSGPGKEPQPQGQQQPPQPTELQSPWQRWRKGSNNQWLTVRSDTNQTIQPQAHGLGR